MNKFYWQLNSENVNWDELLFKNLLTSHPLQSNIWGEAKKESFNIDYLNVVAKDINGELLGLARIEKKYILNIFKVAWIPKGPLVFDSANTEELIVSLKRFLKNKGFSLLVTDIYSERKESKRFTNETIFINLESDENSIYKGMHKKFKYAIRRSKSENIIFKSSNEIQDIKYFYLMCKKLSGEKKFVLPGSEELMKILLLGGQKANKLRFNLELAIYKNQIVSGAIIAFSDKSAHYFWGATNKNYSKYGSSEGLHWYIIKKAKRFGIKYYDLEGIDRLNNKGVFKFKNRMGGDIKELIGLEYYPLNNFIKIIFKILKFFKKLK